MHHSYEDLLRSVQVRGTLKSDRTGTGTYSCFGEAARFDLRSGFPLVTTKKIHTRSIIHELLWFLSGSTNNKELREGGVTIWNEWERLDGDLGPVYGKQWRDWVGPDGQHIDQIAEVIRLLNEDPDSRRIIVSAWNVADLPKMTLAPCHAFFQFYTREMDLQERSELALDDGKAVLALTDADAHQMLDYLGIPRRALSCQLYQRSADMFLGVPFNIASYALLTHMVAQQVNMAVDDFIWTGGDCHIYSNHVNQVETLLNRRPLAKPRLRINRKPDSIFDYRYEDFEIHGYNHHPAIPAPVAV